MPVILLYVFNFENGNGQGFGRLAVGTAICEMMANLSTQLNGNTGAHRAGDYFC